MANKDFKVKNGIDIQSPLPVTMGGTGQTSTTNTLNSLLPAQAGNSTKFLQTDGTNTTWSTPVKGLNSGTLAQRPGSASNGDLYFNTDDMEIEVYQNGNWLIANVTPGIPTGVTATDQGSGRAFNNGQASVAFTASTSGGPVKTFTVTPSPSTSPSTFTGTSSPISVTGLASSTQYTYTVTASSNIGTSSASSASSGVTATTVPQAPTIGTPTNNTETSISVPFTTNSTGGSAISTYTVTSSPSSITATGSSSPIIVSGLTTGTSYTFTVTATNANGTSLSSSSSSAITAEAPWPNTSTFALISSTTISSNQSSISFNTINPKYTDLYLIVHGRTTFNGGKDEMMIEFNDDNSSSYTTGYAYRSGTAGANGYSTGASNIFTRYPSLVAARIPGLAGNTSTSGIMGVIEIDLINSSNSSYKNGIAKLGFTDLGNGDGNDTEGMASFSWRKNSAISKIRLYPNNGANFTTGSTFSLYGVTRNGGYGS
jgi:hypothetical protein